MDSNKSIGRPPISVLQEQFDAAILQRDELRMKLAEANGRITRLHAELKTLVDKFDPHKVLAHEYGVVLNSPGRERLEDFVGSPFSSRGIGAFGDHVQYMSDKQPERS